jgi:hypothetical protein
MLRFALIALLVADSIVAPYAVRALRHESAPSQAARGDNVSTHAEIPTKAVEKKTAPHHAAHVVSSHHVHQ